MDRKELYAYIKEHKEVAELIKQAEGKNYTNCGTALLEKWVLTDKNKKPVGSKSVETPVENVNADVVEKENNSMMIKLLTVLKNKKILIQSELNYIVG